MAQLLVIVGMGAGTAMAIARRFAREGFEIVMLARNEARLQGYQATLQKEGAVAHYFVARPYYQQCKPPPSQEPSC